MVCPLAEQRLVQQWNPTFRKARNVVHRRLGTCAARLKPGRFEAGRTHVGLDAGLSWPLRLRRSDPSLEQLPGRKVLLCAGTGKSR